MNTEQQNAIAYI